MFFEDEKDIIKEGADIHIDEDGTVTWEDVLNTEEDIPSLDESAQNEKLDSELELVQQEDEDITDQELMKILSQEKAVAPKQSQNTHSSEDFDIDAQLQNVVLEQNRNEQDNTIPRKNEKKVAPASSTSPLLLAVLFGAIVVAAVYYGMQFFQNNSTLNQVSRNELPAAPSVQEDMNNLTQEDLEQRQLQDADQENIPVVNEEELDSVEAQQKQEEETKAQEKKQVINVIPTGRANPFMPISKYATTSIPDTSILYDNSGIPKPPEEYGVKNEETMQLMSIAVSGIMYDDVRPSAIITYDNNDYFVQKGDKLDNYRIVDISKNYVKIALGQNIYRANIGEEFKISSKFDGSAQYIPQKQGGGRQYYSVSAQNNTPQEDSNPNKLRYVSEEDITINAR